MAPCLCTLQHQSRQMLPCQLPLEKHPSGRRWYIKCPALLELCTYLSTLLASLFCFQVEMVLLWLWNTCVLLSGPAGGPW